MGRKHLRAGQCFLICIAGVAVLVLSGCATFEGIKGTFAAREYMNRSSEFVAAGDYQAAIEENQRVLSMSVDGVPKDQAAFNIALIYANTKNPARDYRKSLGYFKTLVKDYPESPLREQAETWASLMSAVQKTTIGSKGTNNGQSTSNEQVTSNLHLLQSQKLFSEGKYQEVIDENSVLLEMPGKSIFRDRALFNMGLVYAHHENPDKDYAKSLSYFTQLINEYPDSPLAVQAAIWQNVLNIIEKAKQVDIEIEQKKKELSR